MKGRESGMPDESYWHTFYNAEVALDRLLGANIHGNVLEFGCGFGTFTIPAAKRTYGVLTALDIEPEMIERTGTVATENELKNLSLEERDFVANGTGVTDLSQSHAMIYNLLHIENPVGLLKEAHRVLQVGGVVSVMNWRTDISTPRGPPLEIRPTVEACQRWMKEAGFGFVEVVNLCDCCPYHYGLIGRR